MAGYWFDGDGGNDSNDGLSAGAPKRSITDALDVTGTCTFNIKRGTSVHVTTDVFPQGAFTIRPYGDGSVLAHMVIDEGYQLSHTGSSGSYTASAGLRFSALGEQVSAISGVQCAHYIDGVVIDDGWMGVQVGAGGGWVRSCNISGVRNNGIIVGHVDHAAPAGVDISGNYVDASGASNDGITFHDGTGAATGGNCSENIVIGGTENCIDITAVYKGITILRNKCYGGGEASIAMTGDYGVASGNWLQDSSDAGVLVNSNADDCVFMGNVVLNCGRSTNARGYVVRGLNALLVGNTFLSELEAGISRMGFFGASASAVVKNNLSIAPNVTATSFRHVTMTDATPGACAFNNNYYTPTPGNPFAISGTSSKTFVQWQAFSSSDGGTQEGSSAFKTFVEMLLDASYRPMAGSPCIGAGTRIAGVRLYDFFGKEIDKTPDIGAMQVYAVRDIADPRTIAEPRTLSPVGRTLRIRTARA